MQEERRFPIRIFVLSVLIALVTVIVDQRGDRNDLAALSGGSFDKSPPLAVFRKGSVRHEVPSREQCCGGRYIECVTERCVREGRIDAAFLRCARRCEVRGFPGYPSLLDCQRGRVRACVSGK